MDRVVNEVRLRGAVARVARGALVEIAEGRLDDDEGKTCMSLEVSRIGKMKKCPMTPASTSCLRAIDELHKIDCASAELALGPRRVN